MTKVLNRCFDKALQRSSSTTRAKMQSLGMNDSSSPLSPLINDFWKPEQFPRNFYRQRHHYIKGWYLAKLFVYHYDRLVLRPLYSQAHTFVNGKSIDDTIEHLLFMTSNIFHSLKERLLCMPTCEQSALLDICRVACDQELSDQHSGHPGGALSSGSSRQSTPLTWPWYDVKTLILEPLIMGSNFDDTRWFSKSFLRSWPHLRWPH